MKQTPLQPPIPQPNDNQVQWSGLLGSSQSLAISNLAQEIDHPILFIVKDMTQLHRFSRELKFFAKQHKYPILHFPDWETLPYDHFSPHDDLISQRLLALSSISNMQHGIVLAAMPSLMHRLSPKSFLLAHSFTVACGDTLNLKTLREQLTQSAYRYVDQVLQHGEFTIRGNILDIYPMGSNDPLRIELFDDEVESMRTFDPDTQRSIHKIERIDLLPAHEYPLDEAGIEHFRNAWREQFSGNPMDCPLYKSISKGEAANGAEYYLPLFFDETASFFDYLPDTMQIITLDNIHSTAQQFWDETTERYEQLRYDITRPLCEPKQIMLQVDEIFAGIKHYSQIALTDAGKSHITFNTKSLPSLLINSKTKRPLSNLEDYINNDKKRLLFCAETTGRRETLLDLLKTISVFPKEYASWQDFMGSDQRFGITVAPIDAGFLLETPNIALVTESELFGEQVQQRRLRKQRQLDPNTMIRNLTELSVGAPVVHIDHGIGHYLGLQTINTGDIEAEYLTLQYAGKDKIYVPVSSLHLISRYTGADSERVPVARLGSAQWKKAKEKAAKRIRDIAAELLDLYSQRQATPGFACNPPDVEFQRFRAAFPFEETPDQATSIDAVIDNMTQPHSMDRLVCGDVGFGKTEVAMQAAFLAVQSNKQVVVLVPTTLLATQHEQNFKDRFADWPIKIAGLSRMRTKKESDEIIAGLAAGTIDIVVGTHKLLQNNLSVKDLGLLIVDEEQRFGVRQKEKIKAMRAHVDILTLTATPIPRTLNMAMSGTRDLSLITTPPARRLAVKTFVSEFKPALIREAILRESMRGGQVYFLHNEVSTMPAMVDKLKSIVPEAEIQMAHGQMRERELERVMSDFYHHKFNVLLCSTIIESGIDIPTANTIIMNRADRFGLSQLHQLRGRVGRSHHQAYAYLLTPPKSAITKDASKRLDAISSLEDLGAGFHLATHDLEIRGAGELLGEEQSGHIEAIGFTLYMELLEGAVKALKEGKEPNFDRAEQHGCDIDLHVSALIPDIYVPDVHTRLTLYKRLSNCKTNDEIQDIKAEMVDRFGLLPESTENLIEIAKLRLAASTLGIIKIDVGQKFGYLHFSPKPNVDPAKIIKLIQTNSKQYQLQGSDKLRFQFSGKPQERFAAVIEVMGKVS